jgi:low temperature requirement A protein (LtrA)
VFAIDVKRTLPEVGAHMPVVVAVALCGGVALYLLALSAFKRRNVGSFNRPRLVVAALLVCLVPVATALPALPALPGDRRRLRSDRLRGPARRGGSRPHPTRRMSRG